MKFLKRFDTFYILTFIFLILTSNSNIFSVGNIYWFAALVLMLIVAISRKAFTTKELRTFTVFSVVYLVFVGVRDIFINNLESEFLVSDITFLFKYLLFSFVYVNLLKKETITYLVRVMSDLTVISLFFFLLQLIGLADIIQQVSGALNLSSNVNADTEGYTNIIIFTYVKSYHDYQNSGFLWEPGAFGCFLNIALLLHLFTNKFRFDRIAKILIIGTLTTFSTTTYLTLIVILFLTYRVRYPKQNKWMLLIVPLFIVLLVTVPFLGEKIGETYYNDIDALNRIVKLEKYYRKHNELVPLNRFASIIYVYQSFGNKLIAGICMKYDVILNRKLEVELSNGIADFMARFGLIGYTFLVYCYSKFCFIYTKKTELVLYCIAAFIIIGFGEPLVQLPITLIFFFLANVYADRSAEERSTLKSVPGYERTRI